MKETVVIDLFPLGRRIVVERGSALVDVLAGYGVEFPCGGSDLCGGCRVRVLEGTLPARIEDRFVFSEEEVERGWRLACRMLVDSPVRLEVGQWTAPILSDAAPLPGGGRAGLGVAVDLGTTTIAAQMLDLASGEVLAVSAALNPQCARGADVMSRVQFALSDSALTPMVRRAIGGMIAEMADKRAAEVRDVLLVGNTVMHHLFSGIDVEPLSHAPFRPVDDGEQRFCPADLDWPLPASCGVRFLRCLGGFVGSDILAGLTAAGLASGDRLRVLLDLGTNGEIIMGNRERMICCSTAAGPAFEAGSISMGMRAAGGAVAHVFLEEGRLRCQVIGGGPARGICGSGLVDAVAAGLDSGAILHGGGLAGGAREFPLCGPVVVTQPDIRELQLAKSAVASGMRLLLKSWGASRDDIDTVHLAGAFGNYIRYESALRIGLLEVAPCKIVPAGNAALRGAKMILLSPSALPSVPVEHVPLAFDPGFQQEFIESLNFPRFASSS